MEDAKALILKAQNVKLEITYSLFTSEKDHPTVQTL